MFSNFTPETWPGLDPAVAPMVPRAEVALRRVLLVKSVAASELTDITNSVLDGKGIGQGGVSLGAGLADAQKQNKLESIRSP